MLLNTTHFHCAQAAVQRCQSIRLLELLTHVSWKVDGPCPLKTRETIITHFFKQLPSLKACLPGAIVSVFHQRLVMGECMCDLCKMASKRYVPFSSISSHGCWRSPDKRFSGYWWVM